ncbi:hypothetical protein COLO4_33512 [Corchorus olitorius]|uniref:Uncharacterized protein n=1 Tax=Corchorus olitorius TaxID=93759 RepID=A0A1R3GT01_9ROSI|nr:hypothetical protein COLO4_33512 [Corchorus olitorius]
MSDKLSRGKSVKREVIQGADGDCSRKEKKEKRVERCEPSEREYGEVMCQLASHQPDKSKLAPIFREKIPLDLPPGEFCFSLFFIS